MKQILMIEDELFIAGVYQERLRAEGFSVEVATDGATGLALFRRRKPDLVLLDLMLPQVDGTQVLKAIRAQFNPRELPVLVFTNAFLGGMVQAAWEAGANQVLTKSHHTPRVVVDMIKIHLEESAAHVGGEDAAATGPDLVPDIDHAARAQFLQDAPQCVARLRQAFNALADEPQTPARLRELYAPVRALAAAVAGTGFHSLARLAETLEGLLKVLSEKSDSVGLSVLLTMTQAIDTIEYLLDDLESVECRDLAQVRILVVDDDEFTRQAVCAALDKVNLKATCAANAGAALQELERNQFDLLFLDIEMTDADGYGLCTILRGVPAYQDIPIIFLSLHDNREHRQESFARGGNDFISKPFLYLELALKALSFVIRGSWNNADLAPPEHPEPKEPVSCNVF